MKKRENTLYSREIVYSDNKYYYTYKNSKFFFLFKKKYYETSRRSIYA